jgi:hypothetical protein
MTAPTMIFFLFFILTPENSYTQRIIFGSNRDLPGQA